MPNNHVHPPTLITLVSDDGNKSTVDFTHSSHDEKIGGSGSNSNVNSDSNSTSMSSFFSDSSSHSVSCTKPQRFKKVKLNPAIMDKMPVKNVEEIPWNINGNVIYKIKCTEKNYIDKYQDGHWFTLRNSSRNNLNGNRSTGKCQGSYICKNPECSKLQCKDTVNTIDFKHKGEGIRICGSCGWLVKHTYCGAIKVIEYNRTTGYLTYWHQGFHICTLKPDIRMCQNALDSMPLPFTAASTPQKYMKDCMLHDIEENNYDAGFDVADALSEQDVIEQIKKK